VVKNSEIRAQLRAAAYDQAKVTDASDLIIIAHRTDPETVAHELVERTATAQGKTTEELAGLKGMVDGAVARNTPEQNNAWFKNQTYIPLGMMIETASLLGIDNGPMEGFDRTKVDEILGLTAQNLTASTMLALGYRAEDAWPKTRRAYDILKRTKQHQFSLPLLSYWWGILLFMLLPRQHLLQPMS